MRFAYADPPYPGEVKKHYEDDLNYNGAEEVDHHELVSSLVAGEWDGWALSTKTSCLRWLLPLCPEEHRVLAWVKPFAPWKRNWYPAYAWEPVILCGGRQGVYGTRETPRDWVSKGMTLGQGTHGAKPIEFCLWLFDCFGAEPEDEIVDLFPGSGAVGHAWATFCAQRRLPFPSVLVTEAMFEKEMAA